MPYFEGAPTGVHWRSSPAPIGAGPTTAHGSLMIAPMDVGGDPFPGVVFASSFVVAMSGNLTATSVSQQLSSSVRIGIYTRDGVSLKLLNSASTQLQNTAANNGNTSRWNGARLLLVSSGDWSSAPIFVPNQRYYIAMALYSHITTGAMSWMNAASIQTVWSGLYNGGASNATHQPWSPFRGRYTASTTAMPATIQQSEISGSGTLGSFSPWVRMDQVTPAY